MLADRKYWNPVLETLPQEKIRQLQLKKFKTVRCLLSNLKILSVFLPKKGYMPLI